MDGGQCICVRWGGLRVTPAVPDAARVRRRLLHGALRKGVTFSAFVGVALSLARKSSEADFWRGGICSRWVNGIAHFLTKRNDGSHGMCGTMSNASLSGQLD